MRHQFVLGLVALLVFGGATFSSGEIGRDDDLERVNAPVVYMDLMLIVSTNDAVAAFVLANDSDNSAGKQVHLSVTYRYRLLVSGDAKVRSGEGKAFEKFKRTPVQLQDGRGFGSVTDVQSEPFITAGDVKLKWSYSGPGRGWIYYQPEEMRVQIANARDFENIDLKRFAKKP